MNTLVYHFGGLGDFITTLPLIAFWKHLHAGSVTLLGKPAFGALARTAGYIDTVVDADSGGLMFLFRRNPDRSQLRRFFSPFDAVLLFTAPGSPLIGNACACSRATILCQPPFPDTQVPAVDYHLSLVTRVPSLTAQQRTPVISIGATTPVPLFKGRRTGSKPIVVIHPGSGSSAKNWPFAEFLATAQHLRKRGNSIVWITGPAETGMEPPPDDLCLNNHSLSDIAATLPHCTVFLGNDSGITHLAAACGCPTVALFGPSDPVVWGPRGTNEVRIVHHPPPCAPCHLKPDRPLHCAGECMRRIRPEEVSAAVKGMLRR